MSNQFDKGKIYTGRQLLNLLSAHKALCDRNGVAVRSETGRLIAERLLTAFDGSEDHATMLRKFSH